MPCKPWEMDANASAKSNVRLAQQLCEALELLDKDLSRFAAEAINEDLEHYGGIYIKQGRRELLWLFEKYVGNDDALWGLGDKGLDQHRLVLTRALCNAMGLVEQEDKVAQCSKDLALWWKNHKHWDATRKARGEY